MYNICVYIRFDIYLQCHLTIEPAATDKRQKIMKAIAIKNTFNAKESLKNQDFSYDPETKTWSKNFESREDFENWFSEIFTNVTYSGRKQSKFNSAVVFEFIEDDQDIPEILSKKSIEIVVPTLDEAIELVHDGKILNFKFQMNGWDSVLNGFEYAIDGKIYNIPEIRKISQEADRQADEVEMLIAKQYISCIERQKNPRM